MFKKTIISILCFLYMPEAFASLSFSGLSYPAVTMDPPDSTGLEAVYVLYSTNSVTAGYQSSSTAVKVYRFSSLGGGYAQEIPATVNGHIISFTVEPGDMGYLIEDGMKQHCYWITDYSRHPFAVESITKSDDSDCSTAALAITGQADRITYYSINGAPQTLDREIIIEYNSLELNETRTAYTTVSKKQSFPYLTPIMQVAAPLCTTAFTLTGDRFLKEWGIAREIESPSYTPWSVDAYTSAIQDAHTSDNEQDSGISGLGGSAPCEITFTAAVTDAAVFTQWQMSSDSQFSNIDRRFNETEFTYTFNEQGITYVRFVAGNNEGTCEYSGEVYEINIGESALLCPNAFSPGATEGSNDEWKVSYKSIVDFECHIFNRWGQKMTELRSPQQGWDGRYKGKIVPPGVYYYVIKAVGSDGRRYNLSGDINIINYKDSRTTTARD